MSEENQSGFKRLLADKGTKKMLMFAGGVVAIGVAYVAFTPASAPTAETSAVAGAPRVPNGQGGPVSPVYAEATRVAEQRRVDEARPNLNMSAIPSAPRTVIENALPTTLPTGNEEAPPRPVTRPVVTAPVASPAPIAPTQQQATPPVRQLTQAEQQQNQAYQQAMVQAMAQLKPAPPMAAQTVWFNGGQNGSQVSLQNSNLPGMNRSTASALAGQSGAQQSPAQAPATASRQGRFQVPAPGTILYSRLIGRVNSDTPGPVVAEVLQGPFSGARLIGSFAFSEQGVIISFTSMSVPYKDDDGEMKTEVVPIRTVAVDTAHLGTAMATDIDRHLLERIGVAFGTAFMQGLGQAISQSGSSAVVGNYGTTVTNPTLDTQKQVLVGAGAAAGAVGQVFNQVYGNRRTTVIVEADTAFGLLFLGSGN